MNPGNISQKLLLATSLLIATTVGTPTVRAQLSQIEEFAPPAEQTQPASNSWSNLKLLHTLVGHETAIDALAFSPDGKVLVSGGSFNDPTLIFWAVESGKEIEQTRAQRTAVLTLAFNPNGTHLVSSGSDGGINIWDWETGEFQASFLENASNILSLAFTPDSRVLISGGLDGIKVWDIVPQRPIYTLASYGFPTHALAVNPNGYILASGDSKGRVIFWNLRTGTTISEFSAHNDNITGLAYTPDGSRIVTSSEDRTIKVWDAATRQLLYTFSQHTGPIRAIALNADGETLASGSNDGVRIWNIRTGEQLNWLDNESDWVESVAFSPDGRLLATGAFNRTINIWEVAPTAAAISPES